MWTWDIDIHQTQMKDNTSTAFFNGVKGQDDHRIAVSVVYKKQLVYSQGPSPRKGREE